MTESQEGQVPEGPGAWSIKFSIVSHTMTTKLFWRASKQGIEADAFPCCCLLSLVLRGVCHQSGYGYGKDSGRVKIEIVGSSQTKRGNMLSCTILRIIHCWLVYS